MSDPCVIDTARVRRSFGRSAGAYDAAAVLQARVREELIGRLDLVRLEPVAVLEQCFLDGLAVDLAAVGAVEIDQHPGLAAIFHGIKGRVIRGTAASSHAMERAKHFPRLAGLAREAMEACV